jgi:hypothetical protein
VLSGRGLCDGPIPRPEESYRLWRVFECDQVKIKTLDTCCVQGGKSGKEYERKRITEICIFTAIYLALKKLHCHYEQRVIKVFSISGSSVRLKNSITRKSPLLS